MILSNDSTQTGNAVMAITLNIGKLIPEGLLGKFPV